MGYTLEMGEDVHEPPQRRRYSGSDKASCNSGCRRLEQVGSPEEVRANASI